MQLGINNIVRQSSPNFGKVVEFKNDFKTYNDDKDDYFKFVDTFKKSEPIKEYCSKHDVGIKFSERYSGCGSDNDLEVTIKDLNLDPKVTFDTVMYMTGREIRVKGQERTAFQDLTKQILNLKPNALEERYTLAKEHGEKRIEEYAKCSNILEYKKMYDKMMDDKINTTIDEIKNW